MSKRALFLVLLFFCMRSANAQSQASPPVFQVLMYSATGPTGVAPSVFSYNGPGPLQNAQLGNASLFTATPSIFQLSSVLNTSVATALSVIPLASPASGVITKIDPKTGAELPASSTLGPIFTERGETIGKHKFYIGLSNQDFHFTTLNGQSLQPLTLMDRGGYASTVAAQKAFPSTYNVGMDVRLSQNVAFLTYGVTSRFDVSVGLPVVHAAVSARSYNGQIYVGNGFNNNGIGNCWCVDTYTPGSAPGTPTAPTASGLILPDINSSKASATGFGDMLLRFKGTVVERRKVVVAVGTDLRLPTGDEKNFLGTGATAVKPFLALSLYNKPWSNGIVFSPHINVGWQFAGKSILGGQLQGTPRTVTLPNGQVTNFGPPFTSTKDYLPDVFSWAVGTEVAFGRRNTVVIDVLGNRIGWIHGFPNLVTGSVSNVPAPCACTGTSPLVTVSGLVSGGNVSFGEYSGAFGYKARIAGNLVATFNMLVRFDSNSLTARAVPLFGLSYTF